MIRPALRTRRLRRKCLAILEGLPLSRIDRVLSTDSTLYPCRICLPNGLRARRRTTMRATLLLGRRQ